MLQAIAGGAFVALINMFFVSVYALLPSINIGLPAVILGVAGIGSALLIGGEIFRRLRRRGSGQSGGRSSQSPWWLEVSRELALLAVSVALYGFEIAQGVGALNTPSDANHIFALGNILVCVGALGLLRAWQLLGAWGGPWLNDEK
ncbi:MAG TPA: hypothetical protein VH393_14910 [Ktedonobacterales bacterium]|jgi:hypothetical protein